MGTLKLRRRRTALAAGLATFAIAASLAAAPAQAVDKTKYIALGDSYAAGQGAGAYKKNDTCYRSENAYSELAAEVKAVKLITNAACSGMTTQGVVATQLRRLNNSTELVTITAGGNDLGFGDIVTNCGSAEPAGIAACVQALATANSLLGSGRLAKDVTAMIQSVQAAAPNAKIVVTGYPYLFDLDVKTNDPFINLATGLANRLDDAIAAGAKTADPEAVRVQYVDVRDAFAGHGINSTKPWINGVIPNSPDSFHPNALGYQAYYKALKLAGAYGAS